MEGIVVSAAAQEAGDDGKGSWEVSELSVFETYELGPIVLFVKNTRPFECSFMTSRFQNFDRFRSRFRFKIPACLCRHTLCLIL